MFAVERQNRTVVGNGKLQHLLVGDPLLGFSSLLNRHHVMPQPPKLLDHRERKVFVGVKSSQASRLLILANLLVDLSAMRAHVGPSVRQVLGTQGRVKAQDLRFADISPTHLL